MLTLRPAGEHDSRLLWTWANDPVVRAVSFSTAPIPWERHQQWFARKLVDQACCMFIAMSAEGVPVGQIRFEATDEDQAVVSVSVAQANRGSGLGRALIELGVEEFFRVGNAARIHAFIKSDNMGSRAVFEKAGFQYLGEEMIQDQAAVHYVRSRELACDPNR